MVQRDHPLVHGRHRCVHRVPPRGLRRRRQAERGGANPKPEPDPEPEPGLEPGPGPELDRVLHNQGARRPGAPLGAPGARAAASTPG